MPVFRMSDENWERFKKWAVPLEDTADSAMSRVLDAAEGKTVVWTSVGGAGKGRRDSWAEQLEAWLRQGPGIVFGKSGKSMNTYRLEGASFRLKNGKQPALYVTKVGNGLVYLPRLPGGDYRAADPSSRVVYKEMGHPPVGYNFYPQFTLRSSEDVQYAISLILHALGHREPVG